MSLLFITHDLSVVEAFAHRVMVMYLGEVVESGFRSEVFELSRDTPTRALLDAVPSLNPTSVPSLPRRDPQPHEQTQGCSFASRCPKADELCLNKRRMDRTIEDGPVTIPISHDPT